MFTQVFEQLECRRLLATTIEFVAAPADPLTSTISAERVAPAAAPVQIDAAAVRAELLKFVDTWNGGQLGKSGTSGMGTYSATWDGLFRMNLNRQFNKINYYTNDQTIISQSRAIYMNVEAYRNAPASEQARFRNAVQKGADYLLAKAVDPQTYNGKPGGMWWGLQSDGISPPTHTTQVFGTLPRSKDAYGQVQSLFALAHAYSITADIDHLNGALAQLDVWNIQFADTAPGAGAFLPTANESYSSRVDTRNLDYMTHAMEALLTLSDVLPASHPRKSAVATQINAIGQFITTRMYRDAAGSTTMGYLPWYYDAQWNASTVAGQAYMTPGHNLEVAFLLSRAVERGFNSNWLTVANKLIAFAMRFSFDNVPASPTYGAIRYEKLKFDGTPFNATPDNLVWWQSSEAARTLLHFLNVRTRADLADEYDATTAFIRARFVDPQYGGWFTSLNPTTLVPTTTNKGTVWTGGYHESMLYAEMIRLAKPQPTPFLVTPVVIPSSGSAIIEMENFDNGGEGVAYHDNDSLNSGKAYRTNVAVDIQPTSDAGGGYNIGWTRAGEWLIYSLDVSAAGNYDLEFRVASAAAGAKCHLEADGVNVTGVLAIPNTGGFQTWQTIKKTGVPLAGGKHLLRFVMDTSASNGGVGNFNYIKLTRSGTPIITTLSSTAAAFVRDGSFASTNYGIAATLEVKNSTSGYNRETYIAFDLSSVATISVARLRLFGKLSDTAISAVAIGVYSVTSAWSESAITWSGRSPAGATELAGVSISGTTAKWYEVDLTGYLQSEKAAGQNLVTIVLKSKTPSTTVCVFDSDETANPPQLRITT